MVRKAASRPLDAYSLFVTHALHSAIHTTPLSWLMGSSVLTMKRVHTFYFRRTVGVCRFLVSSKGGFRAVTRFSGVANCCVFRATSRRVALSAPTARAERPRDPSALGR